MRPASSWEQSSASQASPLPLLHAYELDQLPCIALVECNGRIVARNQLCLELAGQPSAAAQQAARQPAPVSIESLLLGAFPRSSRSRQRFDCLMVRQNGRPLVVSGAARPIFYGDRPARLILLMERAQDAAFADPDQGTLMEELLNSVPQAVAITCAGRIFHVNSEFISLFGYSAEQAIGSTLNSLIVPESCSAEIECLAAMLETQGRATIETVRRNQAGEEIDVSILVTPLALAGGVTGQFVTFRDIRQQKLADARLHYDAMHDELTGLANRSLFQDRLRLMMARFGRHPEYGFSVLFLDLDHFKQVNDTLGHAAGDALLREVANRLRSCVRPEDSVARFGGDEFALMLGDQTSPQDSTMIASRIQAALNRPFTVTQQQIAVSSSIGIAVGSSRYQRPEEILRDADLAMYRAKARGKNRFEVFDPTQPLEWPSSPPIGNSLGTRSIGTPPHDESVIPDLAVPSQA